MSFGNLQEIIPIWQQAACDVLIAVGKYNAELVCSGILPHIQAGQLPPFFILQAIGSLAEANRKEKKTHRKIYRAQVLFVFSSARGTIHQLRPIFSRLLPTMGMVKQENYRWVYISVLHKFCLALIDYESNGDESNRETYAPQQFENDAFSALEILLTNPWIASKEAKVFVVFENIFDPESFFPRCFRFEIFVLKLLESFYICFPRTNSLNNIRVF